jgi:hypothetical protein
MNGKDAMRYSARHRDVFGLRYVCLVDEVETANLAKSAGLRILDQFRSDGQEGDLNLYTVLG